MGGLRRSAQWGLVAALCAASAGFASPPASPGPLADDDGPTVLANLDLAKAFKTSTPWRLNATRGPSIDDPVGITGDQSPGAVSLCLRKEASGPCDDQLRATLGSGPVDLFSKPHFLNDARVVHQRSGRPVLLVQVASLHSGDGDQRVSTQALIYRPKADRFERVYEHVANRNNNQEVRFIEQGPLRGDILSADPTDNAPFGFWIVVDAPAADGAYRQVLRYRSATHYGDGNPLAVIDSEMPNIEARLGLWRAGQALPLPAKGCAKPHLVDTALWCR